MFVLKNNKILRFYLQIHEKTNHNLKSLLFFEIYVDKITTYDWKHMQTLEKKLLLVGRVYGTWERFEEVGKRRTHTSWLREKRLRLFKKKGKRGCFVDRMILHIFFNFLSNQKNMWYIEIYPFVRLESENQLVLKICSHDWSQVLLFSDKKNTQGRGTIYIDLRCLGVKLVFSLALFP